MNAADAPSAAFSDSTTHLSLKSFDIPPPKKKLDKKKEGKIVRHYEIIIL